MSVKASSYFLLMSPQTCLTKNADLSSPSTDLQLVMVMTERTSASVLAPLTCSEQPTCCKFTSQRNAQTDEGSRPRSYLVAMS